MIEIINWCTRSKQQNEEMDPTSIIFWCVRLNSIHTGVMSVDSRNVTIFKLVYCRLVLYMVLGRFRRFHPALVWMMIRPKSNLALYFLTDRDGVRGERIAKVVV